MRILLVAGPRTGSTSLLKALTKTLEISSITVPDSYQYPDHLKLIYRIGSLKDTLIRTSVTYNHGMPIDKFVRTFDHTVLLSRKDTRDYRTSFLNLYYKKLHKHSGWHDTYSESEIPKTISNSTQFNSEFSKVLTERLEIEKLSRNIGIPILYYEDLYHTNSGIVTLKTQIPSLDVNKFKTILSTTRKMRSKIEPKII